MKTKFKKAGVLGILGIIGALAAASAFAIDRETASQDSNLAMARQELMNTNIRISGMLNCALADANNGQPCQLNVIEAESGRTYSLDDAGTARALYDGGARNVSIHGQRIEANRIRVINATAM